MGKVKENLLNIIKILKNRDIYPYIIIFFILVITFRSRIEGDTVALLNGLDSAFNCISASPMRFPCGPEVVHFPIFQYLIAMPFKFAGFGDASILHIFPFMNFVWFLISCAVFWRAGVLLSGKSGGHLGLLVLLSGYALWYSSSSFNEAASFALFSLLAICVIDRWGLPYVCIIAFACTITKEIAFPFVVYFMFLSFIARESRTAYRSSLLNRVFLFFSQYKSGLACVAVGIAVNLAFNYFRFGTALNTFNLNPGFITPWSYVPIFFAYLFISPAGGLLFTWFSLCLLLIISLFIAKCDRATAWIVMLATLGLVIANLGLARWYSPFGWCAWGPRLTFPFLGAVGVIAVYLVTTQVINFFMEAGKKYWLLIFVCVVVVSSLPNLTARLDPGAFFVKMFAPTKIEIESGIKNFTVQLAPANLYMAAASKIYARNIVLPITFDVARHKWPISLLWLFSLYLISKRIFSAD